MNTFHCPRILLRFASLYTVHSPECLFYPPFLNNTASCFIKEQLQSDKNSAIRQAPSLVQFSSATQLCPTLWDPMNCSTPGIPVHHQLLELAQTHVHRVNHLILCCPLLLLPSVFPSIKVFSKESVLHIRWSRYWSFSFSISLSNQYSGLISFRIDWFDLLAVRDSRESSPTPQFKSINSLVLSFLYSTTLTSMHDYWKNHSFD